MSFQYSSAKILVNINFLIEAYKIPQNYAPK